LLFEVISLTFGSTINRSREPGPAAFHVCSGIGISFEFGIENQ
jgi:hypothetical protein